MAVTWVRRRRQRFRVLSWPKFLAVLFLWLSAMGIVVLVIAQMYLGGIQGDVWDIKNDLRSLTGVDTTLGDSR